jgi:septal ring factor EnvC (AmiA/AmiB activator)
VTDLSGDEMVSLFKQHLKVLREGRDAISAHIAASQETIKQSQALIVQIDEQINRMERELGWFGGHARRGSEAETVI